MIHRTAVLRRIVALAITSSLLAVGALASPASAYTTDPSGLVGPYSYNETSETPFATCGYAGPVGPYNWIWLNFVRVKAPTVRAADRNSDRRDSKRVSFQLKIERNVFGSSNPWTVVAQSAIQQSTAYEDQAASFSPIKLFYTPKKTIANGQNAIFRALVIVKWLKRDGTVEGSTRIWPTFYTVNSPYYSKPYPTAGSEWCTAVHTNG